MTRRQEQRAALDVWLQGQHVVDGDLQAPGKNIGKIDPPISPLAPGRLSTTTCWLSLSLILVAMMSPAMSVVPHGG